MKISMFLVLLAVVSMEYQISRAYTCLQKKVFSRCLNIYIILIFIFITISGQR